MKSPTTLRPHEASTLHWLAVLLPCLLGCLAAQQPREGCVNHLSVRESSIRGVERVSC